MQRVKGPRQPISINPNGNLDYNFYPMENLAVEECDPWDYTIIEASNLPAFRTESIFSSQTLDESSHQDTTNS